MSIDLAPILRLSREERLLIIQAIAESLRLEEEMNWAPSADQKLKLDLISSRIKKGERGKSWKEVRNRIIANNDL